MLTLDHKPISDLIAAEHKEIESLLFPYYIDSLQLLRRALAKNTHIYLSRINGRIAAFFMIGWETLIINGSQQEALFYGLSCVDINYRQTRISATIYIQAILDIAERGAPFIGWCTTATPIVIRVLRRYWRLIQPNLADDFDATYYNIAEAIRQKHYNRLVVTG